MVEPHQVPRLICIATGPWRGNGRATGCASIDTAEVCVRIRLTYGTVMRGVALREIVLRRSEWYAFSCSLVVIDSIHRLQGGRQQFCSPTLGPLLRCHSVSMGGVVSAGPAGRATSVDEP